MFKILLLLVPLLFFNACSRETVRIPKPQFHNCIMPLAVDNYWIFSDTSYELPNAVTETSKIGITGYKRIKYNDERVFVYFWNWFDMPEDTPRKRKTLVRNEQQGLFYYGQKVDSQVTEITRLPFIKYPVEVDEEWTYAADVLIRCLSVSTEYSTPLGDFNCYVYQLVPPSNRVGSVLNSFFGLKLDYHHRNNPVTKLYYTPEVGYVGMTITEDNELIFRRELTEYYVEIPDVSLGFSGGITSPQTGE